MTDLPPCRWGSDLVARTRILIACYAQNRCLIANSTARIGS
jgi:hypothetical protein